MATSGRLQDHWHAGKPCLFAGVDDINEFEAELEAPDKWARRFRILRESESNEQGEDEDTGGEIEDKIEGAQSATDEEGVATEPKDESDVTLDAGEDGNASPKEPDSKSSAEEPDEDSSGNGKGDAK